MNIFPSGNDTHPSLGHGPKRAQSTKSASPYDLIIVGGGINGAALARLAAFQGLKVAVYEAGDFGQGASSNTSKLLHGGLRYLESYDFALVREAVRERARLLKVAPHLAEERRFHFPIVPQGRHGRWLLKCGMLLYDGLAGREHLGGHLWLSKKEFAAQEPGFLPGEAQGAYAYADCVMDDARLGLETLLDAESLGADIHNYHSVTSVHEEKSVVEVTVLDRFTGRECVVEGAKVALLLGPWTDQVMRQAVGKATQWVRRSQGIHLMVNGLSAQQCLILPVPHSPRYFFVIPAEGGTHWVGTTETEIAGDIPESPAPEEKEIQELLSLIGLYFPKDKIHLIGTYTGVRPLARVEKGATATLSREHVLHRYSDRIFSAVGGKYTTHRPLAVALYRHMYGKKASIKSVDSRPLPGAWASEVEKQTLFAELLTWPFMNPEIASAWLRRYGKRARAVGAYIVAKGQIQEKGQPPEPTGADLRQCFPGCDTVLRGELGFAREYEHARTPIDFLRRRTKLFFSPGGGLSALPEIQTFFAEAQPGYLAALGETADYAAYLKRYRHQSITVDAKPK